MVSQDRIQGNWQAILGAVKERFGQISGDELRHVQGDVERLIGLVQRKTGQSREQIESFISGCCLSTGATLGRISEAASAYAGSAGDAFRDGYDRVSEEAQRGLHYTVDTLKRRPLESFAVVLGAGLLAGLVFGLSLSRRR